MGKEIMFGDTEIEKHKFHCSKSPIFYMMQILVTYLYLKRILLAKKIINTSLVK